MLSRLWWMQEMAVRMMSDGLGVTDCMVLA